VMNMVYRQIRCEFSPDVDYRSTDIDAIVLSVIKVHTLVNLPTSELYFSNGNNYGNENTLNVANENKNKENRTNCQNIL